MNKQRIEHAKARRLEIEEMDRLRKMDKLSKKDLRFQINSKDKQLREAMTGEMGDMGDFGDSPGNRKHAEAIIAVDDITHEDPDESDSFTKDHQINIAFD